MRLDGRRGDHGWFVWHVERCAPVRRVVWIDDETCEWTEYSFPYVVANREPSTTLHKAKRIWIIPPRKLALINPLDDETGMEGIWEAIDARRRKQLCSTN